MKAIFLDRDGTINYDVRYLHNFKYFFPLPGIIKALSIIQGLGYKLFIVTNQSGIARGYFSTVDVETLNSQISGFFQENGIIITSTKYCPHLPTGKVVEYARQCTCRKPAPGMILHLQKEHNISLQQSFMIGNNVLDIDAGKAAGTKTVLINSILNQGWCSEQSTWVFASVFDFAQQLRTGAINRISNPFQSKKG